MVRVLLDTNILILHVAARRPAASFFDKAGISVVSVFETLRLPGLSTFEEQILRDILAVCEIMPVTDAMARRAALLGRSRRTRPLDLLIAATALELGVPLVTKNLKDFKRIPGLSVRQE